MDSAPVSGDIAPRLLPWWDRHGRHDLPWQVDATPYRVWVSEIMLQQTQVATVLRYYPRFVDRFPAVHALAQAPIDEVLHLWSGLGYYARARNLHRAARRVLETGNGEMPLDFTALSQLPGIGRSTAGAILALSAGMRFPILDGNVKRVLCRFFGVQGYPGEPAVSRLLWTYAEAHTPHERVDHYTQAIMDLGATVCRRGQPHCGECPLAGDCVAKREALTSDLPAPRPKKARPSKSTVILMVLSGPRTVLLEKRPESGLWGGLWGFPEVSDTKDIPAWCQAAFGTQAIRLESRPAFNHGFTHFDLHLQPVTVYLPESSARSVRVMEADRWLWYNVDEPSRVGLSAPVDRLLKSLTG